MSGAFAADAASKATQIEHGEGDIRVRQQGEMVERWVQMAQGRSGTVDVEGLAKEGFWPWTVAVMYFDGFLMCNFGAGISPVASRCISSCGFYFFVRLLRCVLEYKVSAKKSMRQR